MIWRMRRGASYHLQKSRSRYTTHSPVLHRASSPEEILQFKVCDSTKNKGSYLFHKSQRLCKKIEMKELLQKMIKKPLCPCQRGIDCHGSELLAKHCHQWHILPVYVVIVDDMKQPEPTPIEQRWRDHQFIQLDIKYHHINNQMLAIPRNFFKKI